MEERYARASAVVAWLSGLLALAAVVPPGWYGATPGDSYVFNPPLFSPLWVTRAVVPVLTVLAAMTLVVGVAALTYRDWDVAGRLRRWSGVLASLGFLVFGFGATALTLFAPTGPANLGELLTVIGVLGGFLVAVVGLALAYLGSILMGVGYARTDRPVVGYALAAAPVLSVLLGWVTQNFAASLPAVLPVVLALWTVGWELWTHPDPVTEASESGDEATGDPDSGAAAGTESASTGPGEESDGDAATSGGDPVGSGDDGTHFEGDGSATDDESAPDDAGASPDDEGDPDDPGGGTDEGNGPDDAVDPTGSTDDDERS